MRKIPESDPGTHRASRLAARAELGLARTGEREDCARCQPERHPLFGDLHVHTSDSLDSYTSGQRNDPRAAYRYAKGEPILLPDAEGEQVVESHLRRPLDFVSVTDHAEFLGEMHLCTTDVGSLGHGRHSASSPARSPSTFSSSPRPRSPSTRRSSRSAPGISL